MPRCRAGSCRSIRSSTPFPKFLAEALIKVEDDYSREFFINNIRVEKAHAEHWLWMGEGFGLRREDMLDLADGSKPLLRDVQSLTDWLWYINTKGALAEAVAATSFAIEGITGDIARKVTSGFEYYKDEPGVDLGPKTYRWMREHAHYDDEHPKIALQIVKRYATHRAHADPGHAGRQAQPAAARPGPDHLLPGLFGQRCPDRRPNDSACGASQGSGRSAFRTAASASARPAQVRRLMFALKKTPRFRGAFSCARRRRRPGLTARSTSTRRASASCPSP